MKSLVGLLEEILADAGIKCSASLDRDIQTLRSRVEHEGDSFITITLPSFCRAFERSLDSGRVDPSLFVHFKKYKKTGAPAFLRGLLFQVFDKEGNLLPVPSTDCIRAIRQICLFGKKVERSCSKARMQAAVESYKRCDDEVVTELSGQLWRYFGLVSDVIVSDLLEASETSFMDELRPHHGPGATQERISGNQKWVFRSWPRRFDDVGFTYVTYGKGSCVPYSYDEWPDSVAPENEAPVRVVFVPKTQKTPRVIAVEPVAMQYMQQGLEQRLKDRIERCDFTSGRINFRDQSVNQELASFGSNGGNFATIDLSEASDRIGLIHVERLLASRPWFRDLVLACRSARAELPNGEILTLKKFASMGSALTFPLESMIFFVGIIASRVMRAGSFPTRHVIRDYLKNVYVYGDDLCVPADEADGICDDLESLGFKINRDKSFWTGKFRESCGEDSFGGERVTPVYIRKEIPSGPGDASAMLSVVATSNQLETAGYVRAARSLREGVEKVLGLLPMLPDEHPGIGWIHNSNVDPPVRWNRHLQRKEMRVWVPCTPKAADSLDGEAAMAKCWTTVGQATVPQLSPIDPAERRDFFEAMRNIGQGDSKHLEQSPTRYSVTLKRSWVGLPAN